MILFDLFVYLFMGPFCWVSLYAMAHYIGHGPRFLAFSRVVVLWFVKILAKLGENMTGFIYRRARDGLPNTIKAKEVEKEARCRSDTDIKDRVNELHK